MKTIIITIVIIILIIIGVLIFNSAKAPTVTNTTSTTNTTNTTLIIPVVTSTSTVTETAPVTSAKNYSVSIANFAFNPTTLNVKKGDSVTWTNNDSAPHQILGSGFESAVLGNGQSYKFTFVTAGTFNYICNIHKSMKGTVVVQ